MRATNWSSYSQVGLHNEFVCFTQECVNNETCAKLKMDHPLSVYFSTSMHYHKLKYHGLQSLLYWHIEELMNPLRSSHVDMSTSECQIVLHSRPPWWRSRMHHPTWNVRTKNVPINILNPTPVVPIAFFCVVISYVAIFFTKVAWGAFYVLM